VAERVEDIHSWVKPFGQSLIAAPRLIQLIGLPLQYGEDSSWDSFGIITAFNLSSGWVGSQVFAGLLLILVQGLFEDWLKVWSG